MLDRTNVRDLTAGQVAPPPDLVVADLSFISLRLVLPALVACAAPDADFVLLVKPQFEVGKDKVGAGGVVRDPALRAAAVRRWRPPRPGLGWASPAWRRARCPARPGTSSTSSGCGAAPRRWPTRTWPGPSRTARNDPAAEPRRAVG